MIDYERVLQALATRPLNHELFEQFALEALQEQYPGLVPIPGGTDWGRDGDVAGTSEEVPPRLMVTSARTLEGVKKNMLGGLRSLKKHGVSVDRVVLANPASINLLQRNKLIKVAMNEGARLAPEDIRDRDHLAPILRRDGHWRRKLLGLPSDPITLSPVPTEAIGTVWYQLTLSGRSAELEKLKRIQSDVVIFGVPGCGKSRLASELAGVAFVDKASAGEQLAPDIRWQQPPVVVVDDAGTAEHIIQRLRHLRATEPDLAYRIIAICWPDEKDQVGAWLGPQAERVEINLIERQVLDEIIVEIGVTNERARTEILNQAEGRVGWAVALASLLLQTQDGTSLLNGRALYGHVVDYLRRAKLNDRVQDVLAVVAALNGLEQGNVNRVAELVGVLRADFNDGLRLAAHGGLIDVVSSFGERSYYARPPMLATALVAERLFNQAVPSVSVVELLEKWPERRMQISMQTVGAAMLGVAEARRFADSLFSELIAADSLPTEFLFTYAMLDDLAATRTVEVLATLPRPLSLHLNAAVCRAYATIAYRFKFKDALTALFDLAIGDVRPTNQYPEHPYRLIEAHVQFFSPDSGHPFTLREWTVETLNGWLRRNGSEGARTVYAAVVKACLSPMLSGQSPHPGNPNTLQLRDAVLPSEWMVRVETELWPRVFEMVDSGGRELTSTLIDVVDEWLNLGDGLSRSNLQISSEAQQQAKATGTKMLQDSTTAVAMSTGLAVKANRVAQQHGLSVSAFNAGKWDVFFTDLDSASLMQAEYVNAFVAAIRAWGIERARGAPDDVVQELVVVRDELSIARLTWPDRIAYALEGIVESADNPREWLEAALAGGLLVESAATVPAVFRRGDLTRTQCRHLMDNPYTRGVTITTVLSATDADAEFIEEVLDGLRESDYQCLLVMLLREQWTPEIVDRLLSHSRVEVRAVVAYAYWVASRHWQHGEEFPQAWFEAIENFRPDMVEHVEAYAVPDLFLYMDSACRTNLLRLLANLFADIDTRRPVTTITDSCWSGLHKLSRGTKSAVWELSKDSRDARHILEWNLAGDDETWLEAQLENGKLSPEEVLNFASGLEQAPSLVVLARLLIPRGVAPKAIASQAELGNSFGERSLHYQHLVDKFAGLSRSDEVAVRQLGEAGVEMYSDRRDKEAEEERRRRIRGQL